MIGITQAFIAYFCNMATTSLSTHKFDHVNKLLLKSVLISNLGANENGNNADDLYNLYNADGYDDDTLNSQNSQYESAGVNDEKNYFIAAFFTYIGYNLLFAAIASMFVFIEPVSAGSGIPEVKCYLNGIDLPKIVHIRTLFCKVFGVTFSVASGLPVGKEGPMVHSGSVVAAGISQGRTKFWGVDTSFSKFSDFRNDREKRDFVACGAAAGVTSAFGSPIGGVLFSLEEGASYWSTKLTWRAFFCAMITLGTLLFVKNFDSLWGQANIEKLFSFGEFNSLSEASNFSVWELTLFIIIGCLGGLIGAVFNSANEHLTIWRMKNINKSKKRRFLEVLFVAGLGSIVSFVMPILWNRCTELPTDMQDWSNQEKNLVDALVPFRCEAGKEYNEVASLFFTDADTAIKQLFHFRENGEDDVSSTFSSAALFLFFFPYIAMATVTYGIAVPSGLFVPSLLSGAAFGRLFGHLLHKLDQSSGTFADSGTYALMGAAAVLGG